uniref:Uncharacterized protein n=1 Tax=Anguilla anguilla TaxID=7936 RepID=A0A0E9X268_ANGAN
MELKKKEIFFSICLHLKLNNLCTVYLVMFFCVCVCVCAWTRITIFERTKCPHKDRKMRKIMQGGDHWPVPTSSRGCFRVRT